MRNLLILALLCLNFTLTATTYYIDPSGNNSNSGTSSSPWKTLAYACTKATASGDIIHVNPGTYLETNQCVLAAGVSIEGEGVTSYIKSHYASTRGGGGISGAAINLSSSSEGTNGNQSISNIKLDGDNLVGNINGSVAYVGILVFKRSNVKIHDCTIVNFYTAGIAFHGTTVYRQPTTSYATGNELYNCTMKNCVGVSDIDFGGAGMIEIGGQAGLLIHDNILTQTGAADGYYGDVLIGVYYNKGLKYYNNKSYKPDDNNGNWNFHIEMWDVEGGFEIYNNEFHGGDNPIDIAGHFNNKGSYAYSWYIHDNLFKCTPTVVRSKNAIQMEDTYSEDVWIYRNRFTNWPNAINTTSGGDSPTQILRRIYIAYNIFDYESWTYLDEYQNIFRLRCSSNRGDFDGFYIYNNIIKGPTDAYTTAIKLEIETGSVITNLSIKNNIILNNANGAWLSSINDGNLSNFNVDNNIIYNNANSNDPTLTGKGVSNYTFNNNIKSDPLFVSSSDYRLQSGSPAVGKGVPITGITTDYAGNALHNPPSIGAYESGATAAAPVGPVSPVYQSAAVQNATPSLLEITYNLALSNIIPAVTAFSVSVNSIIRNVNAVTVTGTKVQLTLASPVVSGDKVIVSYNKPALNPLQTTSGGQAVSLLAQTVSNGVNSVNPVYVSSVIENATPTLIRMTYNMSLANIVPAISSFSIMVNSAARTVSAVSVSGTYVTLTLASRIVSSDKITVSYTKPSSNFLQTSSAGIATSISNIPVTNNCINVAPVAVLTSPLTSSSFASPANISITANATDTDGSVSLVEFYNGTSKIGSATAAPYSFTWSNVVAGSYSLTAVATDNQNTKTVSPAITISVADKKTYTNRHPVIHISNPHKGNSYANLSTITIDAIASDPDGSVSKVEFYNGSERLVEVTTAPYTYIWKNVVPGTYTVTAIATDNLNDTTISSPVEFVIGAKIKYDANSEIVKLFPNPNNGHFSIEFLNPLQSDKSEIVITDMAGKQVYTGPLLKEEISKQFDLSGSRSGVYVMLIKDKDIFVTKKFIKN